MLGLCAAYWNELRGRWSYRAFVCRYGHQDVYALLGRDPNAEPLTPIEMQLFANALHEHWKTERGSSLDELEPSED